MAYRPTVAAGAQAAGAGVSAGVRGARPPGYTPLEEKYPGYIPDIDALLSEGKSEDEVETSIKADIQALVDSGKYSQKDIEDYVKTPAPRSMGSQIKATGKMLWEALTQQNDPVTQQRASEGMVSGATLNYFDPSTTPPANRREYVAKEAGKFVGSLALGGGAGTKIAQGGRWLYGAGKTFLGRTAQGLAENLAVGAGMAGAAARPEGGLDLGGRVEAAKETLKDPLNWLLSGGGAALGGAIGRPMAPGRTVKPEPPPPLPTAPPETGPTPVPAPKPWWQEQAGGRPSGAPAPPAGEPSPARVVEQEVRHLTPEAATLADQQRQVIADHKATLMDLEQRKADALARISSAQDADQVNRLASEVEALNTQALEAERKLINAQKSEVFVAQPKTTAQPPPRKTMVLGSKAVVADPTPPGATPTQPMPADSTIIGMIWRDTLATGELSPQTTQLIEDRATTSRTFDRKGADKAILDSRREWEERQGPPPVTSGTVGKQTSDWILEQYDKGYQKPLLDNVSNDSVMGAIEHLRRFVSGTVGERRLDVEGWRPAWFVRDPEGPRPYNAKNKAGDPPDTVRQALQQLEQEATDRGLWKWWKVPLRPEDVEHASHAVEKGVHPTKGHRVELFIDGAEGKTYTLGDVWIPDEEFKGIDWKGKLKLAQDLPGVEPLSETEAMLQKTVDTMRSRMRQQQPRPRDVGTSVSAPRKAEPPQLVGVADLMRATGFGRPLAERVFKTLMPEVDLDVIRDTARVRRMDDLVDALRRKGHDVGDLERERATFDGWTQETYDRYRPSEGTTPEERAARPEKRTLIPSQRLNEATAQLRTDWKIASRSNDTEALTRLTEQFKTLDPGPDATHKIVTYTPEGKVASATDFTGSAQEARQAFDKAKASQPGSTMELLRVKDLPGTRTREVPTEMPKPPAPVGPPTHQVAVYQDGKLMGTKDFYSEQAANVFKDYYSKQAAETGASITFDTQPYAPGRPQVEAPEIPTTEGMAAPARPKRPTKQAREEVRVPERPEEAIPRAPEVYRRSELRGLAEERGYQMVESPPTPGAPFQIGIVGPDGRFFFDDYIKLGQFMRNKFGLGATASDIVDAASGKPQTPTAKARVRKEQNTIQPNATRMPMPPDMPTDGMTLGAFAGFPIPLRVFSSPETYRRGIPAAYGALRDFLMINKAMGPADLMSFMRHAIDTEQKVPGTVNSFLEAAQQRLVFDNPADWMGQPQTSSNPFIRNMSTDALLSHDIPKIKETRRQLVQIAANDEHLTTQQRHEAYRHVHGISQSTDPTVLQAVQAFRAWGDDIRQMANLPPDWHQYIAGVTDKQVSYNSWRTQFLGEGPDFSLLRPDLKAWFKGPDEYATFFRHIEKNDDWNRLPRNSRDLINNNGLTWDVNSPSYHSLPDEVKNMVPPGMWHKLALRGGAPAFESLAEFQRAILPELMHEVFTKPYLERWQPWINLFDENQGVRHWSNTYNQMVVGGAERSSMVHTVDNAVRGLESMWGKAIADDHLLDNLMTRVNRNMYRGLLGGALDSAVRNSSSIITNFAEFGPTRIMKSLLRRFSEPGFEQLYQDTKGRTGILTDVMWDLQYGRPGVPREGNAFRSWLAETIGVTRDRFDYLDNKFTQLVMFPMHFTDNIGKGMALMAGLDEALQQGMPIRPALINSLQRMATVRPDYILGSAQQEALMRTYRTQFGHLPSTQSTFFRNPLMRGTFMFWNYPSKLMQLGMAETFYDAFRLGAPNAGMRYMRYLGLAGLIGGGAWIGKEIGLDLSRVFGSGLLPSFMSPILQWPGNLYNLTIGDTAIPDDKWANTWGSAVGGLAGLPVRYPMKVAGAYEAAQKGMVENAYGKAQYETNGWAEFMRAIGIEYGDTYRDREIIRLTTREEREYRIEKRNAIGRFVKSDGQDTTAVERFNAEWGKRSGGKVITGDELSNAMTTGKVPRIHEIQTTAIGQRVMQEMGATP